MAVTLSFNLAWEATQLPFYTVWADGDVQAIVTAVMHCSAGDVLIAATLYAVVAAVLRRKDWVFMTSPTGRALALALGLAYTAWSERQNLAAGTWAYASAMPTIAGIGLMPMLQWIIVPTATWGLLRRFSNDPATGVRAP